MLLISLFTVFLSHTLRTLVSGCPLSLYYFSIFQGGHFPSSLLSVRLLFCCFLRKQLSSSS